jgi:hypothetical protein
LWPSLEIVFRSPNSPPLRHRRFLQVVSKPGLAHLKEVLIHPPLKHRRFLQVVSESGLAHLKHFSFSANRANVFRGKGWIPIGHHTSTALTSHIIVLEWLVT